MEPRLRAIAEVVRTVDLEEMEIEGEDPLRFRIEILKNLDGTGLHVARLWRFESYGLHPTVENGKGTTPRTDEVVLIEDTNGIFGIESLSAPDPEALLAQILETMSRKLFGA